MRYGVAALAAVAGIATCAALGAATPVTPPSGAVITTPVLFKWTLPANEESVGLDIANKPDTTPEGEFPALNVIGGDFFLKDERQWVLSQPGLFAGRYWWLVRSKDRNSRQSYYSVPVDFTIPLSLALLKVEVRRYLSLHRLDMTVRWRANPRALTVGVRLLWGGRVIWARTRKERNYLGHPNSITLSWQRPRRIKAGTRLTLLARIVGPGKSAAGHFTVKAP